jgi:FixJ family two-component response regulator
VVITDAWLPGMSGLDLLRRLRSENTSRPVIVVGEETDVRAAVDAMREGAADFIEKQHMDVAIPRRVAYLLDRTH